MSSGATPLLLVGAGKMGGALLDGWLAKGVVGEDVTVLDPFLEPSRRAYFEGRGTRVASGAGEACDRDYRVIILAVKPQTMAETLASVVPLASRETTILSVAAGVRIAALEAPFGPGQPVVRAMPNTPAQVGMGMTVSVPNGYVSDGQRETVDALLRAVGEVAWISDEAQMDAVTAVSGSGPAYVFLLAECLAEAGRRSGLPADLADLLGHQTVVGAGALLGASEGPAAVLRQNVTSPNGTTAAALSVLMAEDGLQLLIARAVEAAKRRSIELG